MLWLLPTSHYVYFPLWLLACMSENAETGGNIRDLICTRECFNESPFNIGGVQFMIDYLCLE